MEKIVRRTIDWEKTGRNLQILRMDNLTLRRQVCFELNFEKGECEGNCSACRFDMDASISRAELAAVFHTSDIDLEDMLLYCRISGVALEDILVYEA